MLLKKSSYILAKAEFKFFDSENRATAAGYERKKSHTSFPWYLYII